MKDEHLEDEHFWYEEEGINLYDVDHFISQIKTMMQELVKESEEFAIYIGIDKDHCLQMWARDEKGTMYQVEPHKDDDNWKGINDLFGLGKDDKEKGK